MWQHASLHSHAEPSQSIEQRPPGKRTLTAALQRKAAPQVPDASAANGDATAAPADAASGAPAAPLADPFWFADAAPAGAADRLPANVQRQMESSFGADFSDVRIGVGDEATAHGALAFARGNQIRFAPGQYDPTSTAGLELIGHELAHVVQQRQGRASSSQHKGGVVEDTSLEAEADHAGALAARGVYSGLGAGLGTSLLAGVSDAPIQRKTSIGIVGDVAAKSISSDLLWKLAAQHGVSEYAAIFERAMLWWADDAVKSLAQIVIEELSKTSLWAATQTFATCVNPYLSTLSTLRAIYSKIPEVIQNLIAFSLGRGMGLMFGYFLGPAKADAIVNTALLDGGSFLAKIDWAYKQLFEIANAPASWAYNLVWGALRSRFRSSASSPAVAFAGLVSEAAEAEAAPEGGLESGAEAEAEAEAGSDEPAPAKKKEAPKQDLRYLWLDVDAPTLKRFDHQGRKSGGLELPFTFGANLFGTKLETLESQDLHLPWSGGFAIELNQLALSRVAELPPVFSVGELVLQKVVVTDKGLEHFAFVIKKMSFADETVVLTDVAGVKSGDGLRFSGAALIHALDTEIKATAALGLDANGHFQDAALEVAVLDRFPIVPDLLSLSNPSAHGSVAKGGAIALGVRGDLDSAFSLFKLDAKGVHLDYQSGKGSAFSGGVDALTIQLGEHVTLRGAGVAIDRDGLRASELSFEYKYDADAPQRGREEMSMLGGLGPDLLGYAGLSSLTLKGKVLGLRIGKAGKAPVTVASAEVALPRAEEPSGGRDEDRAEAREESREERRDDRGPSSAPRAERSPVPGVHYREVQTEISKISASAFGLSANLDLENGRGDLSGAVNYAPAITPIQFEWHVLPGLAVYTAVSPSVSVGAGVKLSAEQRRTDAFALAGQINASGAAKVNVSLGAQAGTALIAALRVGVFAEGAATAEVQIGAGGVIELDRQSRSVRASARDDERPRLTYSADAALKASAGIVVTGHAFLVFSRELYRYTFKEWTLGQYHLEGHLDLATGEATLDKGRTGFPGGEPQPPTAEPAEVSIEEARALLRKRGEPILGSADKRKELHQQIRERYKAADASTLERLREAERRALTFEEDFAIRRDQMSLRAERDDGLISNTELQEYAMWQRKVREHEEAVQAAQKSYRELLLMLTKGPGLSDDAIEAGELDLDAIEASIRRAADLADRDAALTRTAGPKPTIRPEPSSSASPSSSPRDDRERSASSDQ